MLLVLIARRFDAMPPFAVFGYVVMRADVFAMLMKFR